MPRKLAAGNWKMNGTGADLNMLSELANQHPSPGCDILICPPASLLHRAALATKNSAIMVGGQDCHADDSGAHTGDISAPMLLDAGGSAVILGHSERRQDHGETNGQVLEKAHTSLKNGLLTIVCVGESLAQRDTSETLDVIAAQLSGSLPDAVAAQTLVVAYEPIWAIGTGKVPTTNQIGEVHGFMRSRLKDRYGPDIGCAMRLLYGGSVKASNASDIFAVPDVDGALVGGASLTTADFSPIINALEDSST